VSGIVVIRHFLGRSARIIFRDAVRLTQRVEQASDAECHQ
jgi:hypothetical protein